MSCSLCFDDDVATLTLSCGHGLCMSCWQGYIDHSSTRLYVDEATLEFGCPEAQCTGRLGWQPLVPQDLASAIIKRLVTTLDAEKRQACPPTSSSSSSSSTNPSTNLTSSSPFVTSNVDFIYDNIWVLRCPQCRTPIDMTYDGCNSVTCASCTAKFCGVCFGLFENGRQVDRHVRSHGDPFHADLAIAASFVRRCFAMISYLIGYREWGNDPLPVLDLLCKRLAEEEPLSERQASLIPQCRLSTEVSFSLVDTNRRFSAATALLLIPRLTYMQSFQISQYASSTFIKITKDRGNSNNDTNDDNTNFLDNTNTGDDSTDNHIHVVHFSLDFLHVLSHAFHGIAHDHEEERHQPPNSIS
eukprot:GILJ01013031.1.p1 GENE.GILJ01013031.1~~GILJ01013031.1.p1  ORF type:complete len:357 (-),score=30.55 GILJ01013031.1:293-1363(-)